MTFNHPDARRPCAEFLTAFAEKADADGSMAYDTFIGLALYHPVVGYYRQHRARIGYAGGTDFFTAATSGAVFGELVSAACVQLLGDLKPSAHTFVEIGAERGTSVFTDVKHPFRAVRTLRLGEPIEISGPCVVFSNELFDAQPFRRFRFRNGHWRELGVARQGDALIEIERTSGSEMPGVLPVLAPEGYVIDAPFAAVALAETIAAQPWTGLFVGFDYGKSWQELTEATPAGTARGYFRHTQTNDLLDRPGAQDLTCHACWDWLIDALARNGFASPRLQTQEAFFVRHAESYLAPAIAADATRFTKRKQSLLQLLHGTHLGHKFQVLHALR